MRQDQDHFYAGVDAGLTYTQGNTTFGAAIYYEASGDERTLGGRLGLSQKLDDALAPAKTGRFNWSGFYIGANAGMAWGEADARTATTCHDTSPIPPASSMVSIAPSLRLRSSPPLAPPGVDR